MIKYGKIKQSEESNKVFTTKMEGNFFFFIGFN